MSLIDEALKRAQAAEGDPTRPGSEKRPWSPAPLPDQGRIRRRRLLRGAAIAAAVLVIAAAGLVFLRHTPTTGLPLPAGEGRGEGRPTAILPTPVPLEDVRVAPPPRGIAANLSTPAAGQRPATALRTPGLPSAAAPGAPDHPADPVPGKTYVGSITLPGGARIELGGIVYSESNATALVNGKILGAGSFVEGFVLQRIEEGRIELADTAGRTIFLALK